MLGLLLIFFIGKYYYELAQDYYKHRWLYGIFGIAIYYVGTAIGGVVLGIAIELFDLNFNLDNTFGISIIALVFGVATAFIIYFLIKRQWNKPAIKIDKDEIQNIGSNIDENN